MLKAVVFDSGWGGEMFADYLEEKVPVIEVVRVIDWREAPYSKRGRTDICIMADKALAPYIGEVDVIVLASFAVTVSAMAYLKWKYPEQKFVGFEMNLSDYVENRWNAGAVMALATGVVAESVSFEKELMKLSDLTVITPECSSWIQRVDDGEMTEEILREELGVFTKINVGTILLYSTGFTDLTSMLKNIYGQSVAVVDDFARVVHRVCMALNLRGADGRKKEKAQRQATTRMVGLVEHVC
ncbi:hypothetical protein IJI55_01950 [Candidatus Saccharibacteria bacterium]|nr:hypothetical protein [Candidatus Saccharibacteria bacterium]MBR3323276.1 hypothetical protein [Candidatus Saccharibacteria bacterium]